MSIINQWRKFKIPNKWTKYKTFTRSTVLKEKLEEYTRRLQGIIEELGRRNYNLERKGRAMLSWDIVRILIGYW